MCINVGIDLDGVVANFSKRFSESCREVHGDHLPVVEDHATISSWDWSKWYPLNAQELGAVWDHIEQSEENFWETLEVLNDVGWRALLALQELEEVNVYFITSRPKSAGRSVHRQSVNWLAANGWINPQVIVTHDKADFASLLDLKYFIDDNSYNVVTVKSGAPYCQVFVPDYPYNRDVTQKNIVRLSHPFLPKFVGSVMSHFPNAELELSL